MGLGKRGIYLVIGWRTRLWGKTSFVLILALDFSRRFKGSWDSFSPQRLPRNSGAPKGSPFWEDIPFSLFRGLRSLGDYFSSVPRLFIGPPQIDKGTKKCWEQRGNPTHTIRERLGENIITRILSRKPTHGGNGGFNKRQGRTHSSSKRKQLKARF